MSTENLNDVKNPESEKEHKIESADKSNPRQEKWDNVSNEVKKTIDTLGHHIDENIKETVVALNVYDINTSGSCEGHIDWGTGAPWVEISASDEPEEIYVNEKTALERVARENNVTVDDLKKEDGYEKLYREAMEECAKNGEMKEIITWQEENEKLKLVMENIISDFYKNRDVPEDIKIKFRDIGGWGSFRIYSGTDEDYDRDFEKMNEKEKKDLGKRLEKYQKEIADFTKFLKDKFFEEGGNYINELKNSAQKKIDKKKISNLRKKLKHS